MAASRLPILNAAPSLDDLPPLPASNLETVPLSHLLREIQAREPFHRSAQRFIRTPGPAERAERLAQTSKA